MERLIYSVGKDLETATPARLAVRHLPCRARPLVKRWRETLQQSSEQQRQAGLLPVDGVPHRAHLRQRPARHRSVRHRQAGAARDFGVDFEALIERRTRCRRWATAAWAGWRPASSTRWPPSALPGMGYGIRYEYGMFRQRIVERPAGRRARLLARRRQSLGVPAPRAVLHGALRRPASASRRATTCVHWVDTEDVLAMAYDTIIPGYGTPARPTRCGCGRRGPAEEIDLDGLQPRRLHARGGEPRTTRRTSRACCTPTTAREHGTRTAPAPGVFLRQRVVQDILRRYLRNHANFDALPDKVSHPPERHPPGARRPRADAPADRRARPALGRRLGAVHAQVFSLHQPHADARRRWRPGRSS